MKQGVQYDKNEPLIRWERMWSVLDERGWQNDMNGIDGYLGLDKGIRGVMKEDEGMET